MSEFAEDPSWEFDSPVSKQFPVFTRANISEVMPNVLTPLNWTLVGVEASERGWRDAWVRLGAYDPEEFSSEYTEAHSLFGGYLYLNLSIMRRFAARTPGMTTDMIDVSLLGTHPDVPAHVPSTLDESPAHAEKIGAFLAGVFAITDLPELAEDLALVDTIRRDRPVMSDLSPEQLVAYLRTANGHVRPLVANHIVVTMSSSVALGHVSTVCAEVLGDARRALDLVSALGGVVSAELALDLWALGRAVAESPALMAEFDRGVGGLLDRLAAAGDHPAFLAEVHRALRKHEYRGVDEFNIAAPTWGLRPELPLAAVERMRFAAEKDSPANRSERLAAERERLTAEVLDKLKEDPAAHEQFAAALRVAQMLMRSRERSKTSLLVPLFEIRLAALELGRRMTAAGFMDQADDVFYLANGELDDLLGAPEKFTELIRSRRAALDQFAKRRPPFIINGGVPPLETWESGYAESEELAPAPPGAVLQGIGGCPGQATGIARVVLDPAHPEELGPDDILIAPLTDPAWTPLFTSAAAVVVEHGAPVSHAVIISRELGIPCVVSLTGATRKIRSAARVTVDGSTGTVTVHD